MTLQLKLLPSTVKVMPGEREPAPEIAAYTAGSALRGEVFAFQLAYSSGREFVEAARFRFESPLAEFTGVRRAGLIPTTLTAWKFDDHVIRREPGLFPDPLLPLPEEFQILPCRWNSLRLTVHVPPELPPGEYKFKCILSTAGSSAGSSAEAEFRLQVCAAALPPQSIERSEWLHCDALMSHYRLNFWSREFRRVLKLYFRNQTAHGCTRLLTPLFTPPLDTAVGCERPTVQLVGVSRRDGRYRFDFTRLDEWCQMALQCGYDSFEFAHLFTQWGAKCAPKIVVDGRNCFGWESASDSPEYREFLSALFPPLNAFLAERGLTGKCVFHASDEPQKVDREIYARNAAFLRKLCAPAPVTDALSELDFYRDNVCLLPVCCINEVPAFEAAGCRPLWSYYCCGPETEMTNRFLHYPGGRTRMLGAQLFRYDCAGFLHWGYNFWLSRLSRHAIDPWKTPDAEGLFPGGDPFLVYPGADGSPVDSIRHELLREAFQDHRALTLLAERRGRPFAEALLADWHGGPFSMSSYPAADLALCRLRDRIHCEVTR